MSSSHKKICFCTTIASSMITFILPIAEKLHNDLGYEITIICTPSSHLKKLLPPYIKLIPVKMKRGLDPLFLSKILRLIRIFKKEQFDMVQYTTPNASFYASIAAKQCHVPIRYYCQWGLRYVGYSGIKRSIFKFIEKQTCKNSTHIQSASNQNRQIAISEGLCSDAKIHIIGQGGTIGVDTTVFDLSRKPEWKKSIRKKYDIPENAFVYGFVGRINKDKGCNELLQAFQKISTKNPNKKLLIIGNFDQENGLDPQLKAYARKSPNIIITGKISNGAISQYYSAIDILVHPTYREGFGMVIQEAGALMIPTITTNIPGASEVMEDGHSAILITPHSSTDLASCMIRVARDESIIKKLGTNAYARVKKYYQRAKMLNLQAATYEKILKH